MPEISTVIPTYNRASLLDGALASALNQSFEDCEVLVIDDGSTDATAELVAPYVASGRVRYIRQANQGVSAARNTGIQQSRGRFIAFLDSDDTWTPSHLEHLHATLRRYPDAAMAFSHFTFVGDTVDAGTQTTAFAKSLERFLRSGFTQQEHGVWLSHPQWRHVLFELGFPFRIPGSLIDREFLRRHGLGFDERIRYTEEAQFIIEASGHTRCLFIDVSSLIIRRHEGNIADKAYQDSIIASYDRRVRRTQQVIRSTVTRHERAAYFQMMGILQARVMYGRAARAGFYRRLKEGVRMLAIAPTIHSAKLVYRLVFTPSRPFPE